MLDYPKLFQHINGTEEIQLDNIPLTGSVSRIHDEKGAIMKIIDAAPSGKKGANRGTISIGLRLPPLSRRYNCLVCECFITFLTLILLYYTQLYLYILAVVVVG